MRKKTYDPDEFLIPASDSAGHGAKVWARVPPGILRQISELIAAGIFPYKTSSDLLRHALDRHLPYLNSLEPLPSITGQVEAANVVIRRQIHQQEFTTTMADLNRAVEACVKEGALGEARRLVSQVRHALKKMPDGYWRDRYLSELRERFEHLFDGLKVSLVPRRALRSRD